MLSYSFKSRVCHFCSTSCTQYNCSLFVYLCWILHFVTQWYEFGAGICASQVVSKDLLLCPLAWCVSCVTTLLRPCPLISSCSASLMQERSVWCTSIEWTNPCYCPGLRNEQESNRMKRMWMTTTALKGFSNWGTYIVKAHILTTCPIIIVH